MWNSECGIGDAGYGVCIREHNAGNSEFGAPRGTKPGQLKTQPQNPHPPTPSTQLPAPNPQHPAPSTHLTWVLRSVIYILRS